MTDYCPFGKIGRLGLTCRLWEITTPILTASEKMQHLENNQGRYTVDRITFDFAIKETI